MVTVCHCSPALQPGDCIPRLADEAVLIHIFRWMNLNLCEHAGTCEGPVSTCATAGMRALGSTFRCGYRQHVPMEVGLVE